MNRDVTVKDIWQYFGYRQITGDEEALNRPIEDANTNRPGLELSGYLDEHVNKRVVIMGEKEINYVATMDEKRQQQVFEYLTGKNIPMILISRDLPCPKILFDIADKKNFPVFTSFAPTNTLIVEIVSYLEEFFAPVQSIHGVLLQVYGKGILIRGDSGVGKSEIALELIKRGHILVADDRVDIYRIHNHITGEAPSVLKNMLEIRGVGIINVASMFGVAAATDKAQIDFVIDLQNWNDDAEYDRVGLENEKTISYFGISLPQVVIPVSVGRSIAVIIEAAVTNQILRGKGYNSSLELRRRVMDFINEQKED